LARELVRDGARALTDADFDLTQKGVDVRVGLDMARLALPETVGTIIMATGDSDFVPGFKFVRREGVFSIRWVTTSARSSAQQADVVI
jgi:uncharacterized LabA/DUF88 family protein